MKKALALSLWQQTALCFLCAQMVLYIAYSQHGTCGRRNLQSSQYDTCKLHVGLHQA